MSDVKYQVDSDTAGLRSKWLRSPQDEKLRPDILKVRISKLSGDAGGFRVDASFYLDGVAYSVSARAQTAADVQLTMLSALEDEYKRQVAKKEARIERKKRTG